MNIFFYTISISLMILFPIILAGLFRRRFRAPWLYFCVGILTFVGSQVIHLPLNELLERIGLLPEGTPAQGEVVIWAVVLGFTAGLTEELARAAGYWLLGKARALEDGLMLGLGHGGIEAMTFGGVLTAAGAGSLWFIERTGLDLASVPAGQLEALQQQLELLAAAPGLAFLPLIERLLAVAVHVTLSLIVLYAFRQRKWLYLLVAILYHALIDAGFVYLTQQTDNVWLLELYFLAIALPGFLWAWRFWRRSEKKQRPVTAPVMVEWAIFITQLKKELLQQWRTKRIFVVGAVFILFGMTSPLVARYTPEILRSVEGAEQFAGLIPDPTIADALGQYIKNLTQFGFILAILLGMGAVAGEKEKGTAAMVMSKPLPRWAFVLSKFLAQTAVYLLAFVIAALGAYYYTLILFSAPAFGPFLLVNLFLLIWLLVYVAVSLLGSTLGRSTGAAAGMGAVGAVLLLLAGSIPRYGPLAPGGLVTWAGQLALNVEAAPNSGALAMSLVLILVCLVAAVAAFEEQEL